MIIANKNRGTGGDYMKVLDNLQYVQQLKDKISSMEDNFNKLQGKYHKALNEIELIKGITIDNKGLKRIISTRNKRIRSLEDSIHDLKGNYQ